MKNETEIWRSRALAHEENYYQMLKRVDSLTEQRDRLAAAVNAATVLIAAKGRHNTLLAYEGLRSALSPENT